MCGKEVNTYSFAFDSVPDWYKTQEMCDRVAYENPFLMVYFPDEYTTQKMCDEAVDDCLAALKLLPDWFVARKMTKNLLLLWMQMKIYSTLTKVMVRLHLIVEEWVLLV